MLILFALQVFVLPTVAKGVAERPEVLDQVTLVGSVYKSFYVVSAYGWVIFALIAAAALFFQFRFVGAARTYWQARLFTTFNVLFALYAAAVFLATTIIMAVMIP